MKKVKYNSDSNFNVMPQCGIPVQKSSTDSDSSDKVLSLNPRRRKGSLVKRFLLNTRKVVKVMGEDLVSFKSYSN